MLNAPHGQHETGVVALKTRDRLEYALAALRKTVPRITLRKGVAQRGGQAATRHAPRTPTKVTNLHWLMIARDTYDARSSSLSLALLLPQRIARGGQPDDQAIRGEVRHNGVRLAAK